MATNFRVPYLRLYEVITRLADRKGITVERHLRDNDIRIGTRRVQDHRFEDGNLHIIDDRSVQMPNVLNASLAYFKGFWHLDSVGTRFLSSIGALTYDGTQVPFRQAKPFYQRLQKQYRDPRNSRYRQPRETQSFPGGAISVFFQGSYPRQSGATRFDDLEMLRDVLKGAGDRPVLVKPHPLVSRAVDIAAISEIAARDARVLLCDANVHDMLATSCVSVSINSTVALEGFLHQTPAILYGRADFHHMAETVSEPECFDASLVRALARKGGYAQYMTWYFRRNCLAIGAEFLDRKIWQIFAEVGFPPERFGADPRD